LGIPLAPKRSTLAYANEHRPWQLYETVFGELLGRCRSVASGKKQFRFKNKLLSLDSTSIDLCASLFDWAKYKRTKGAVKVHLLLENEGCLPSFACLTDGKQHDVTVGRTLRFAPGTILAIDKGYVDYDWWRQLTEDGVFFVTRAQKGNFAKPVLSHRRFLPDNLDSNSSRPGQPLEPDFASGPTAPLCPIIPTPPPPILR
jgi:hypothetical protein